MDNMINETWEDAFIEALYERYPRRSQLIKALMKLLLLEREAVYRRLRKDVSFSMHEIVVIASAWNISLDKITGINPGQVPFLMQPMNYITPSEQELAFLWKIVHALHYFKNFPETEFMDICNKLPRQLLAGYQYANQFSLFKWNYQYGESSEVVPFAQIKVSDEKIKLDAEYFKAIQDVPNSNFIWDPKIFENFVKDVLYFHSVLLVSDKDKELIKNDLHGMLDYLHDLANKGYFPESRNKVNLYISQVNIDTNYSYTFTPEANICFIHALEKFELFTYNLQMVENFRTWMQLKKRTSIQISEVDERSRIIFFGKQRQLVDSL